MGRSRIGDSFKKNRHWALLNYGRPSLWFMMVVLLMWFNHTQTCSHMACHVTPHIIQNYVEAPYLGFLSTLSVPLHCPLCLLSISDGILEHKILERTHESRNERGDKESPNICFRLKSCESLYTCPRAPFYRETNGLLHSEITLEFGEYS
jgi:hypothetical protein